jgi:hypothetical protein
MNRDEREILEALDAAVRTAATTIEPLIIAVDSKLRDRPEDVLAWTPIPLDSYPNPLPDSIRSSWVFVLRAGVVTGAERHPNSHQRMMSYRGHGDFQTRPDDSWRSHFMSSGPSASLEERWISIPPNVWHQGIVGPEDWAVVSFHTVPEEELIEERPAAGAGEHAQQRRYAADERHGAPRAPLRGSG